MSQQKQTVSRRIFVESCGAVEAYLKRGRTVELESKG